MRVTLGEVLTGPAGTATEVFAELEPADAPDLAGTVAAWFLECPGQSPAWSHYALSVVHLRPIPGGEPPHLRWAGATHEVMLRALSPSYGPTPEVLATWHYLTPFNVVEQLELPGDEAAAVLLRLAATAVVAGRLPAEPLLSGAVEPWRSALRHTAEHFRSGGHG